MQMRIWYSVAGTSFPRFVGRLGLAVCLVFGAIGRSKGVEPQKAWIDWQREGNELLSSGNFTAAVRDYRRALATGQGSPLRVNELVSLHESLAWAYSEEGQFAESECEYRQALELVQTAQGTHSLDYALLLASMSLLPTQTGDRNGAIKTLRRHWQSTQTAAAKRIWLLCGTVWRRSFARREDMKKPRLCWWNRKFIMPETPRRNPS